MQFRKVAGFAVAWLLIPASAITLAQAEPMQRSPRPEANPKLVTAAPAASPAAPTINLTMAATVPPASGATSEAAIGATSEGSRGGSRDIASQPDPALAALRAPVNPRLGIVTLSSASRPVSVPDTAGTPAPGAISGRPAAFGPELPLSAGAAPSDLPQIGEMLPASMPSPAEAVAAASLVTPPPQDLLQRPQQGPAAAAPKSAAPAAALPQAAPAVVAADPALAAHRPKPRPARLGQDRARVEAAETTQTAEAPVADAQQAASQTANAGLLLTSLRPKAKPKGIVQLASAPAERPVAKSAPQPAPGKDSKKAGKKSKEPVSAKGSVCGVAAIKGEKIAPITSKVQGCGLSDGVRVTSVSGVRLSMAATIDCATAKALNTWVERAAQPAYGNQIVELQLAGHYVCRPRNNKKGAKVSEHGRGKAVDISGFRLASGKVIRVLGGFDQTMRKAHKGACGIFGTTLGPGSDGYHEDHLHFDTASHRSGAYCR
ncbi:hypothetical protein HOY34_17975 [Xinfangfangia sp. D13-10-4-6]|uniref:extensin-like domain-containing protein n=1 Tax=Pseudogemmobacter hezensis TaxID=2737662 RepID=UPI001553D2CE|nr:extensin family protein [Pseudogemmobacter hezensis]NPD17085.1 hypothetical protein [Pseudogemmobacter hezensis]